MKSFCFLPSTDSPCGMSHQTVSSSDIIFCSSVHRQSMRDVPSDCPPVTSFSVRPSKDSPCGMSHQTVSSGDVIFCSSVHRQSMRDVPSYSIPQLQPGQHHHSVPGQWSLPSGQFTGKPPVTPERYLVYLCWIWYRFLPIVLFTVDICRTFSIFGLTWHRLSY